MSLVSAALKVAEWLLNYANKRADTALEKFRIEAGMYEQDVRSKTEVARFAHQVVRTGMANWLFWIPWLIATVPLAGWFAWGVLDTAIYDGALLPDVGTLPPQLKEYADVVWGNIFFAGGGVVAAGLVAKGLAKR